MFVYTHNISIFRDRNWCTTSFIKEKLIECVITTRNTPGRTCSVCIYMYNILCIVKVYGCGDHRRMMVSECWLVHVCVNNTGNSCFLVFIYSTATVQMYIILPLFKQTVAACWKFKAFQTLCVVYPRARLYTGRGTAYVKTL